MSCLSLWITVLMPRMAVAGLYLFSDWLTSVFETPLWPILGFAFAPTSLLWYSVVVHLFEGAWDPFLVGMMILAVIVDLAPLRPRTQTALPLDRSYPRRKLHRSL